MRYFYRPSGAIAWRELLVTLAGIGGVLAVFPGFWRAMAAVFGPWVASAFALLPLLACRQPGVRNTLLAGIGSLASRRAAVRQESGRVEESEAEREVRSRDSGNGGSYLTAHANYLVRVRRADGARRTLQLPRELWAPLRVGDAVGWTRRGLWLLEIHPPADPRVTPPADPPSRGPYGSRASTG